jgi:recombination protein RecA
MPPKSGLAAFQEQMTREFGEDRTGPSPRKADIISTGSLTLDMALGEGGLRTGRIYEFLGPPDSGKSSVVINTLSEHQARYPKRAACYVDMEGTFDDDWAEANGLSLARDRFEHLYPGDSEDASDMARKYCRSGHYSIVAVDSIGGMESRRNLAKDAIDPLPGANAQVITRMVKHLASLARQNSVTIVLVNQPRAVIGSAGMPDQPAGPKAMQHATTTRVRFRRAPGSKDAPSVVTMRIEGDSIDVSRKFKATVDRTKLGATGRSAEFWINSLATPDYGPLGINRIDEYVSAGISRGVIAQEGSWYTVPGAPRVQGRNKVVAQLRESPALMEAIRRELLRTSQ